MVSRESELLHLVTGYPRVVLPNFKEKAFVMCVLKLFFLSLPITVSSSYGPVWPCMSKITFHNLTGNVDCKS